MHFTFYRNSEVNANAVASGCKRSARSVGKNDALCFVNEGGFIM